MAALSDYLENKLIDHLFRSTAYTAPAGLYVGLFTANENDAGGGAEVTGGSYARVNVAPGSANWANTQASGTGASTGTTGTTSNINTITFPAPTASWGALTGVGVFDASTGGNLLFYSALTTAKTVNNGDAAPSFAAGAFTFQIDN